MENEARLNFLLQQLTSSAATDAEMKEIWELVEGDESNKSIGYIEEQLALLDPSPLLPFNKEKWMAVADKILAADTIGQASIVVRKVRLLFGVRKWIAAAAILLVCCALLFWLMNSRHESMQQPAVIASTLPVPGKSGAVLTLSDGTNIVLDSLSSGVIANQAGTAVQLINGKLSYDASTTALVAFNTLTTPKGRRYQVQLPDGTGVWLNSGSSITYPTFFKDGERRVKLSGEAYFEVIKNAAMPFYVSIGDEAELKVLGTSFNLNTFKDNGSIDATLLEGAVAFGPVRKGTEQPVQSIQLRPGQQAKLGEQIRLVHNPDINKIMAWKNGYFNFEGNSLTEVMKQLERWYDIHVIYPAIIPDIRFFGELNMETSLEGVLLALERSGVRFSVHGRTITVTE